jgi:flagellar biosynthesis/type III secretory pathway protein FliH
MVHTVKMENEEQSGHLAENEVARLLSVLKNAEFKRSETRNITTDYSFKPRSLMEIAVEAQQRDAEIEAVKQSEEALAVAKRAEAALAGTAQVGNPENPNDTVLNNQESAIDKNSDGASIFADGAEDLRLQTASLDNPQSPIVDAHPNLMQDMKPDVRSDDKSQDLSSDSANRALTNDSLANDVIKHDPVADDNNGDADKGAQIATNFETVTAAFERGKAEGIIAGREEGIAETIAAAEEEAQSNLADKIAAFEAALVALVKPQALQAEDLSRSIHAAILKLASQRAGQQIDEMPTNFLARIEALVISIGQKMAAGKIHINADDYKVMLPYLADAHFNFVAEPSLARGDIILKFAGVELHDIAESRLGGQYAETAMAAAKTPIDAVDLAPEATPAEIVPAETTPVEAADASSPDQNVDNALSDNDATDNDATDNDAPDNAQDDGRPSPLDEASS